MKPECLRAITSLTLLVLAACGGTAEIDGEGGLVGDAESALVGDNALNPNALNPNALNPNALNPNALSPLALGYDLSSEEVMSALQAPGEAGALSRQLLRYTVRCALKDSHSIAFSWSDDAGVQHQETYTGSLGLAPSWFSAALVDEAKQRWVSACLAALVNYYGTTVMVSLRGTHAHLNQLPESEFTGYNIKEGAFWGNLFSSTPYVRACHDAANVDLARQRSRDCAAGHLADDPATVEIEVEECGVMHIVGPCDAPCGAISAEGYFERCRQDAGGAFEEQVITTWLQ